MSTSGVTELAERIPELWSPLMYDELRNSIMFSNIFSRKYEGVLQFGKTVNVQQLVAPTGEILTDDKALFASESVVLNNFDITVNKRASASFEITDLADLQSLSFQMQAREALVYAIRKQMEADLISALIPSASAPDHQIAPASASDLSAADLTVIRTLMSTALIPVTERMLFLAPSYYGDLLNKTQVTSLDFQSANSAQAGVINNFSGFTIMEHNLLGSDVGYAVHPSALQLVMQQDIRVKVSDLHSQKKYGYLVSADMVYGYKLFDNKRIVKIEG